MRFAGQRVSDFTGGVTGVENYMQDSPDYGKNAQAASNINREQLVNSIGKQSDVANQGIISAADVEGAKITGAAQSSLANAQGDASVMAGIGKIGGALIGGMNIGGGATSGIAGDANVMGMDMGTANHIGSGGYAETVIDGGVIGKTVLGRW
tara:strand:+ start:2821 stop:3276 length:456 start_codon:yes stop_codon:yes gene_type:complete